MKKILILGGGISGLSAAWNLHKRYPQSQITLLEKQHRLGGWIESRTQEGFFFELGPRTLSQARSPALLQLIEELGLTSEIISSKEGKRYLWYQGRLRSLGSFWPMIAASAIREWFIKSSSQEDESIHDFAVRRFGSKMAAIFFASMAYGVYAGDSQKLSIRSCFRSLWEWEQTDGSVVRGFLNQRKASSGLFTLRGGLELLVHELRRQLPIEFVTDCAVEQLTPNAALTSKGVFEADRIVSALPAFEISRLTQIPLDVPYNSVWVVQMGFDQPLLRKSGFGYLVPPTENEPLLGMVWDSEIFSLDPKTRLTAMIRPEGLTQAQAAEVALSALRRHLRIDARPPYLSCHLSRQAIPQMEVGHEAKIAAFQQKIASFFPILTLVGNYFSGVSLEAAVQNKGYF